MTLAIVRDDRYLEHSAGDHHPESPNRLRVIHDLLDREFRELPRIEPRPATEDELALVHDPFYIEELSRSDGKAFTRIDGDTALSARSYQVARLAAGGLLNAVDAILAPSPAPTALNPVFCFVRPPGHHAEPGRGMGFCLFNNIAIAAEYAIEQRGVRRVLIVDWDLHHGNGTQRAFYDRPDVLYFSSHQFPHYPGTGDFDEVGAGKGEGFTVNVPFPAGFGDGEYAAVYERVLKPIALEYRPELVLVSAGFDPYVQDPLGGMELTGSGFGNLATIAREIADTCCGGKMLLALEGGYNPDGLREGVRSVLEALTGPRWTVPVLDAPKADRVIRTVISHQKGYWKSLR
ncbi:MAG: histone deacetylase [Nitrospiraceae bacterium]|nr:histone deacetylase [Nitrospiraceae bacterium]